ncbi:hypothetical protein FGO68_gene1917 [Halteria grandinella]|uniref:Uncharacterized protein n=1 Tax=Halteria grandinella TaxID=5974 RepID=A0A8J8T078_HALGN|nr:hypothetical protein FGO68_gene1917 [Halteria grandinella]
MIIIKRQKLYNYRLTVYQLLSPIILAFKNYLSINLYSQYKTNYSIQILAQNEQLSIRINSVSCQIFNKIEFGGLVICLKYIQRKFANEVRSLQLLSFKIFVSTSQSF